MDILYFSEDGIRKAHRLRLQRNHLLHRQEPQPVRMPGMVPRGTRLSSGRLQLRPESPDSGPGDAVSVAERHIGQQPGCDAPASCQHVLHDKDATEIRERVLEAVGIRESA